MKPPPSLRRVHATYPCCGQILRRLPIAGSCPRCRTPPWRLQRWDPAPMPHDDRSIDASAPDHATTAPQDLATVSAQDHAVRKEDI